MFETMTLNNMCYLIFELQGKSYWFKNCNIKIHFINVSIYIIQKKYIYGELWRITHALEK